MRVHADSDPQRLIRVLDPTQQTGTVVGEVNFRMNSVFFKDKVLSLLFLIQIESNQYRYINNFYLRLAILDLFFYATSHTIRVPKTSEV